MARLLSISRAEEEVQRSKREEKGVNTSLDLLKVVAADQTREQEAMGVEDALVVREDAAISENAALLEVLRTMRL